MNETTKKCKYCKKIKPIDQFVKILTWRRNCCNICYKLDFLKKQREKDEKAIKRRIEWYNDYEKNRRKPYPLTGVLCRSARKRAKEKNLKFDLTPSDIVIPEKCPVLGIELKKGDARMIDGSPTIDRIDPLKGYTKDNICVISNRANRIKSDGTIEEHKKVIQYIKSKKVA